MCDDCCKQFKCAIKSKSMEPSENSCQRDFDTVKSLSKSECEFELYMAKEINNMELASESSNTNVELTGNEQCTDTAQNNANVQEEQQGLQVQNQTKEREDRPLVLEERHSLSIAETKKRRARVHSNDHLFIPKELARSELHQRTYYSSVNTLDQISRNSDYCIRMLKFPVGSGRARYVAQQMQKKRMRETQKLPLEEDESKTEVDCIKSEPNDQENPEDNDPSDTTNLEERSEDRSQLQSDDERCIVLEDIVSANSQETETEEDGTDDLIERVSKRQLKQDVLLDLTQQKDNQLNSFFRWHDPNDRDQDVKMGMMDDLNQIKNDSFQVVSSGDDEPEQQQLQEQQQEEDRKEVFLENLEEFLPASQQQEDEPQHQQCDETQANAISLPESEPLQQQHQYFPDVPPTPAAAATTSDYHAFETQSTDLTLNSLLMQRFTLTPMQTATPFHRSTESLQHNLAQPLEMLQQWNKQQLARRVYLPPTPHALQQQHSALRQQEQQQHQTLQHQLDAGQSELQHLNTQYHALKAKEAQQLNGLNKALKRLFVSRQLRERQHADYQRTFLQKMEESKKQENGIYEQKNQLRRQLQTELSNLEQRIADKQRQLLEHKRTWHWQQQQHIQQQQQELAFSQQQREQQLQQQQHQQFYRQLQTPAHPTRLQCFQDAFLNCQLSPGGQHRPPPPIIAPPPPPQPPPPPMSACCASNLQQPVAQSFNSCIMRRQRIIDYRANNISPYFNPFHQPIANTEGINYAHSTATNDVRHIPLPNFSELSRRNQTINQAIEQTAITSIISNYASNYFNNMGTTEP